MGKRPDAPGQAARRSNRCGRVKVALRHVRSFNSAGEGTLAR